MEILAMIASVGGILIGGWIYLERAHEKGWKMLIPFYNLLVVGRQTGISDTVVLSMYIPFIWVIINPVMLEAKFGKGLAGACYIFAILSFIIAFISSIRLLKAIFQSMSGVFATGWYVFVILFFMAPGIVSIAVALLGTYWRESDWNEF